MKRSRSSFAALVTLVPGIVLVALLPVCSAQDTPAEVESSNNTKPADETKPESDFARSASDTLREFETQIDKYSGQAVGFIAGLFFYEFAGRSEFTKKLEEVPFGFIAVFVIDQVC